MNILDSQIFVLAKLTSINLNTSNIFNIYENNELDIEDISRYLNDIYIDKNLYLLDWFRNVELNDMLFLTEEEITAIVEDLNTLLNEVDLIVKSITIKNYKHESVYIYKPDTLVIEYRIRK